MVNAFIGREIWRSRTLVNSISWSRQRRVGQYFRDGGAAADTTVNLVAYLIPTVRRHWWTAEIAELQKKHHKLRCLVSRIRRSHAPEWLSVDQIKERERFRDAIKNQSLLPSETSRRGGWAGSYGDFAMHRIIWALFPVHPIRANVNNVVDNENCPLFL